MTDETCQLLNAQRSQPFPPPKLKKRKKDIQPKI